MSDDSVMDNFVGNVGIRINIYLGFKRGHYALDIDTDGKPKWVYFILF